MKVFKFPDVNKETWDGSGLKKKHLKNLAEETKRDAQVKAARRVMERLQERMDKVDEARLRIKSDLDKARRDYFKLLGDVE